MKEPFPGREPTASQLEREGEDFLAAMSTLTAGRH